MGRSTRDSFLSAVRRATAAQPVTEPDLPAHDEEIIRLVRPQADLAGVLAESIRSAGMEAHLPASHHELPSVLKGICAKHNLHMAIADADPGIDLLVHAACAVGLTVRRWGAEQNIQAAFDADVGLTGVTWAVAETGSLVLTAGAQSGRMTSLAPLVHVALIRRNQIVADLCDLFGPGGLGSAAAAAGGRLPSGCVLITGPSKTADIELNLVTGVHGPGFVHAIIMS